MASRSLRLARPASAPPLRDLSALTCYLHNADLRAKYEAAITWMRSREGGSKWILDKTMQRKQ